MKLTVTLLVCLVSVCQGVKHMKGKAGLTSVQRPPAAGVGGSTGGQATLFIIITLDTSHLTPHTSHLYNSNVVVCKCGGLMYPDSRV